MSKAIQTKLALHPSIQELTSLGDWELGRTLGVGNYGVVRLCRQLGTGPRGDRFAMKVMSKKLLQNKPGITTRLENEWRALVELEHPHILQGYEVVQDPQHIGMVTEFLEGGDLLSLIRRRKYIHEDEARRLFIQILSAVMHAHEQGIVHRDLKAENVFLTASSDACVGDWGFCTQYRRDRKLYEHFGSVHYAAPELFLGRGYIGPEIDIWSLGVLLFAMTTGNFPFYSNNPQELGRLIVSGSPLHFPSHLNGSHGLRHLIQSMLDVNPKSRYTAQEVSMHPWIRKHFTNTSLPSLKQLNFPSLAANSSSLFDSRILPPPSSNLALSSITNCSAPAAEGESSRLDPLVHIFPQTTCNQQQLLRPIGANSSIPSSSLVDLHQPVKP